MSIMDEWSRDPHEFEEPREPADRSRYTGKHHFHMTATEIAKELDMPTVAVRGLIRRSLEKIKLRHPTLKDDWL